MAASDSLNSRLFDPGPRQATPAVPDASSGGMGQRSLFNAAPYSRQPDPANVTPAKEPGGFLEKNYQLPMFMTPREIHEKYEPLAGDRLDSWTENEHTGYGSGGYDDPRHGQGTNRSQRTDWVDNDTNHYKVHTADPAFRRPKVPADSGGDYRSESTDELYDRKYEEAHERSASGYDDSPLYINRAGDITSASYVESRHSAGEPRSNYSTGGAWHIGASAPPASSSFVRTHYNMEADVGSLADSIIESGVKSPVRLGETTGIHGKPEVVGGHHRLAVATVHAPDQFIPVLHHRSIRDAKSDPVYKYS